MSFTWTYFPVVQYSTAVTKTQIDELRTKCDFLNDNMLYCGSHYDPYYSNHWPSHRGTYYLSNNSQCGTYNSTQNTSYSCYSSGTCFPAGIKILLYNGRWISIEDIRPSDEVMSFYGSKNKILDIYNTKLGTDRLMLGFEDDSLFFTPEESLWARTEKEEYWTVSDYNKFLSEENFDYIVNGKSYSRYGLKRKKPILQLHTMEYAHLDGWKSQHPIPQKQFDENTIVYNLIPDGDFTYFVNGYITYGAISDEYIDFTKYKWNILDKKIDSLYYLSDSKMVWRNK